MLPVRIAVARVVPWTKVSPRFKKRSRGRPASAAPASALSTPSIGSSGVVEVCTSAARRPPRRRDRGRFRRCRRRAAFRPSLGCVLSGWLSARRRRCPIHPLLCAAAPWVSMRSACHLLGDNECRHPAAGPARPAHDGGAESDLRRRSAARTAARRRSAGRGGGLDVLDRRGARCCSIDPFAAPIVSRNGYGIAQQIDLPDRLENLGVQPCARSPGGQATWSVTAPRRRWR